MRYVATLGAQDPLQTPIGDLDLVVVGGQARLYAAAAPGQGGVSVYTLSDTGVAATIADRDAYGAGATHAGPIDLMVLGSAEGGRALVTGVSPSATASFVVAGDGTLSLFSHSGQSALPPATAGALAAVTVGAQCYLYASVPGQALPWAAAVDASGGLVPLAPATGQVGSVDGGSAMVAVQTAGADFLVTASPETGLLRTFAVGADGRLAAGATLAETSGIGFSVPTTLAVAHAGGGDFIVVGGAASSSLSVLRLLPDGSLLAVDHVVDSLWTRFQGATAIEVIEIDGRSYVLAGGADDGLTLFGLMPDGRLLHLTTIEDGSALGLADVTALATAELGGRITAFVASATEPGITQLEIGPGAGGITRHGGVGTVTGGSGNDWLVAGRETTRIEAGAGDDTLSSGSAGGAIALVGGAGSDRFVLGPRDGATTVLDFQAGIDRLDLGLLPGLRNLGQLDWRETARGAEFHWGGVLYEIATSDGTSLPVTRLSDGSVLPLSHFTPPASGDVQIGTDIVDNLTTGDQPATLLGFGGDDRLQAGAAADRLFGGAGADWLYGASGDDQLFGEAGADTVLGGDGADQLAGGDGDDLMGGGADGDQLRGGDGNDRIYGAGGDDSLWGEAGIDFLVGGAGTDQLDGGDGADTLRGDEGDDRLLGAAGDDMIIGGTGQDILGGGPGNDRLWGEDGNDRMWGADGIDDLRGGAGNDLVDGGEGADLVAGEGGNDRLVGGGGNDRLFGADGTDVLDAGAGDDRLYGGTGCDQLLGGAGADIFVFRTAAEAGLGNDCDLIVDFQRGIDRIDLSALGLHLTGAPGLDGSRGAMVLTAGPSGLTLAADLDGNRTADLHLRLAGISALTAADLLL